MPAFVRRSILAFLHAAAMLVIVTSVAKAQDVSFAGKIFTINVGTSAGGGYDLYARSLARYLPKHLPGAPTVTVRNMPGAGGLILANYLYNLAPKDGSEIGAFEHGTAFAYVLNGTPVKFDPMKFGWLGSLDSFVPIVLVWHDKPIHSVEDLKTRGMTVGASGIGSNTAGYPFAIDALLGLKIKVVNGYPGSAEINFAVEKGEVDGISSWCWDCLKSQKPDWLAEKKVRVVLQLSINGDPELTAMGVPTAMQLATTEEQKKLLAIVFASAEFGRPFAAPPGLDPQRLKALQIAFEVTARDPEFVADMTARQSTVRFSGPAVVEKLLETAGSVDQATRDKLQEIYSGRRQ
jgi:hypothetical protein